MSLEALRGRLARRRADLRGRLVAVIAGGSSAERDVSLISGRAVATALLDAGWPTELLCIGLDDLSISRELTSPATPALSGAADEPAHIVQAASTAASLESIGGETSAATYLRRCGLVFTTLHGTRGEDGVWQGLLELLDLPYVSANVKGSALAMDKLISKRLYAQLGVPTPEFWVERRGESCRGALPASVVELVAKPVNEGSSVGIEILGNDDAGWARIAELVQQFNPLLIERRIHGRELTAGVIGPADDPLALPLVEIRPHRAFYDYTAKYTKGESEYICPAELAPETTAHAQSLARLVYREFDLDPYMRCDFILDEAGTPWMLEANTLPGFTPLSLLPQAARAAGIEFTELLEILMLCALERWERRHGGRR